MRSSFLIHFISKACILFLVSVIRVKVSQPYSKLDKTREYLVLKLMLPLHIFWGACHGCCGPRNMNADLGCAGAVLG